ncbi:MAG: HEAT repeat domain-containing protein [Deltaproteobacteria bacterium]|nr:HEAT repeat domain-containing protein [Deltaproteobacteria bacterium]
MCKRIIFLISITIANFNLYADMVDEMINELKYSSSFKSRLQAAIFLGKMQDKRAVDVLIANLKDEDYAIKGACAIALGNIGDPKATRPLIELLRDPEPLVRKEAIKALIKLASNKQTMEDLISTFKNSEDSMLKMGIISVFGELKDDNALKSLADGLSDKGKVGEITSQIIMGMSGENKFKVLSAALESKDENTRINAMELVGTIKDPRLVSYVLNILKDSSSQEEIKAAKNTLRKLKDKIDVEEYLRMARFGRSKDERDIAIQMLAVVADERCIGLLMDLLKDEDVFIRGRSVQALASIGDKRAIPQLEKMLKDKKNERIFPIIKNSLKLLSLTK